jgi:ribosomal protein L32
MKELHPEEEKEYQKWKDVMCRECGSWHRPGDRCRSCYPDQEENGEENE